jgi:hypothetical protein
MRLVTLYQWHYYHLVGDGAFIPVPSRALITAAPSYPSGCVWRCGTPQNGNLNRDWWLTNAFRGTMGYPIFRHSRPITSHWGHGRRRQRLLVLSGESGSRIVKSPVYYIIDIIYNILVLGVRYTVYLQKAREKDKTVKSHSNSEHFPVLLFLPLFFQNCY